jgi:hypothetical protein
MLRLREIGTAGERWGVQNAAVTFIIVSANKHDAVHVAA